LTVITHYSRRLTDEDVHPAKQPRRTRIARSIIDVASWMATDRGAMAVLAAGVQQRLVRVEDARQVAEYRLAVEIDGAQHTEDPRQRWDDMERDIDLGADGYGTLRFPAWLVRQDPAYIARRIQESLRRAGYRA
jgi:very-short-patch-repair endonuclease